jgi:hypothetical protein
LTYSKTYRMVVCMFEATREHFNFLLLVGKRKPQSFEPSTFLTLPSSPSKHPSV